jgi:hypothetical protein
MGKFKYTVGVDDDAQSGQVLCCKARDRKEAAISGEATSAEPPKIERRRGRNRVVSVGPIPKRFAPEKLTAAESISGT